MSPRLRIAVVLPGGLSFGAYEAGVCSSLVEVVKTSRGDVVVDLIVGASCGAVTGLMTALALRHADALSHLEELWVERASLRWLVWPRSSSGPWSPLSTAALERWGQVIFSTAHCASLQDEPVRLLVALAPLDGADTLMPSGLDQDGRELYSATWSFRDARRFVLGDDRNEWFEALDAVLASAAHPLGFAPRKLPDLSGLLRDATWFTDGGASDNLPLHLALDALDAEPCDDATRLVVIVNRPVARPEPIASPTFVSTGLRALKMLWEGPLLGDLLKGRALPAPLMIVSPDPASLESTGWANIRGFFSRSIRQRDFARGQRDFLDRWLESAWSIASAPSTALEIEKMSTPNLLVLRGHVDVRTVWPDGSSDADTLRLFVDPSTTWATFRKNGVTKPVRGLDRAVVHGSVVRPVVSPTKAISIRLQGIDAPELHYRAPAAPRTDVHEEPRHAPTYRQPFGEMSSAALHDFLGSFGDFIEIETTTQVDAVGDAFDTYGRFVGDVFVIAEGQRINVNDWLVARGWAFPTFYTSMSGEETIHLTKLAQRARTAERGVWARYTSAALPPDPRRVYRGKHAALRDELGLVGLPKLFRRRVAWREANLTTGQQNSFHAYLQHRDDQVLLRRDFLVAKRAGTPIETRPLLDFMNGKEIVVPPWDLVFSERPAELRFR